MLDGLALKGKGVEIDPTIFRPATFIERSIDNLGHAMLVGCGLVIADPRRSSSTTGGRP